MGVRGVKNGVNEGMAQNVKSNDQIRNRIGFLFWDI